MELCDRWLLGFNEGSGELRIVGEITGLMPGQPVFTFKNSATSSATEATPRLAKAIYTFQPDHDGSRPAKE
jgi:hypothetical protein